MITIAEVRDLIATLGIAEDTHVYSGKLPDKLEKSIGCYNRKASNPPRTTIGTQPLYEVKPISILVHWNKYQRQAEQAAQQLYKALQELKDIKTTNNNHIAYAVMLQSEPIDVATDDKGIYEYVIELDFIYYSRKDDGEWQEQCTQCTTTNSKLVSKD